MSFTEPFVIERPRLIIEFTPPGEIEDLDVQSIFFDTTVTFFGDGFKLTLQESNTVFSKRANINYESRVMKAVCGEAKSLRQADFAEMMTGATGSTSSNPIKVGEHNACLLLSEMSPPDEEATFSFTLMFPFYDFSGEGPLSKKKELLETLRSFRVYGIDPELTKPLDKEIPQKTIDALQALIHDPLDKIIDTNVLMTRDDEVNPDDIMNPACAPISMPTSKPIFSMGLVGEQNLTIRRDGFIPIMAKAEHFKNLLLKCRGVSPCGEGETWISGYYAPVHLEWEITAGEASFVEVGCMPENIKKAKGESVILRPPMLMMGNATKGVTINLSAFDEDNTLIKSETITVSLTSKTLKNKTEIRNIVTINGP
ncbi:MAG: hypothetical protein AAFV80_03755, partial [Bacteroidota bacterium]